MAVEYILRRVIVTEQMSLTARQWRQWTLMHSCLGCASAGRGKEQKLCRISTVYSHVRAQFLILGPVPGSGMLLFLRTYLLSTLFAGMSSRIIKQHRAHSLK